MLKVIRSSNPRESNVKYSRTCALIIVTCKYCKTGLKYSENNNENIVYNSVPVGKNQS